MHDPLEISDLLLNSGIDNGFEAIQYGEAGGYPLLALKRQTTASTKQVYLSSGVHGDEPAAVFTLVELLRQNALPLDLNLTVCPLVNPTGFAKGTRENEHGIDLNRDFKVAASEEVRCLKKLIDGLPQLDFSVCLHEDWEATGFYLYYLNPLSRATAQRIIFETGKHGPIEPTSMIDGREAEGGIVHPPEKFEPDAMEEGWPEAFYLYSKWRHEHFTLETPSGIEMEARQRMATRAVHHLLKRFASGAPN